MSDPLKIKLGIDFDNTLVCYDPLFDAICKEKGLAAGKNISSKTRLRDALRIQEHGELEWTRIQGEVYGPRILEAKPFEGALEFIKHLRMQKIAFCIISHKTRFPVLGPAHDLHAWAKQWLQKYELIDSEEICLSKQKYFFELRKEAKLERIALEGCTHFIDDLPEFLSEPKFPTGVHKVLFAPAGNLDSCETWRTVQSWAELHSLLPVFEPAQALKHRRVSISQVEKIDSSEESIEKVFRRLLQESTGRRLSTVRRLEGGANNRAFELKTDTGRAYFGKRYFISEYDQRDRLSHEVNFTKLLCENGFLNCAKPIASDVGTRTAVFEFIEGHPLSLGQPVAHEIWEQSLDFLISIQSLRKTSGARNLPLASEAAFSLEDHLAQVRRRRDEWLVMANAGDMDADLAKLISGELEEAYEKIADEVFRFPGFRTQMDEHDRILSPSDFGIHNVLVGNDGNLTFLDFEYAGWDDPAKTVADFFLQPRFEAPMDLWESLVERMSLLLPERGSAFARRLPIVRQCMSLKWCYILLNDFHPEASKRRRFALDSSGGTEMLQQRISIIRKRMKELHSLSLVL
jgi:hypothetical protein